MVEFLCSKGPDSSNSCLNLLDEAMTARLALLQGQLGHLTGLDDRSQAGGGAPDRPFQHGSLITTIARVIHKG